MKADSTDAAWAAARAAEPGSMSRDEIAALLAHVRRARSCLDSVEVQASRRLRQLAATGHAEPAETLIANAGGHSGRDARSITDRDELCAEMPDVEDALADGQIAAGYVDAIAAAARDLPEAVRAEFTAMADELLRRAEKVSLDAFRRECRDLAKHLIARSRAGSEADELAAMRAASKLTRWVDRVTGMHHTHIELDPIRDSRLHSAANRELARIRATNGSKDVPWKQLLVEAFVNGAAGVETAAADDAAEHTSGVAPGCETSCTCGSTKAVVDRVPEITGLVTFDWLAGLVDHGICETEDGTPIPIDTMRRLCCDAEIVPTVLGGNGRVLDHGRSRRTASPEQRQALRAMHRGCAHPDCNVGFSACRIHHIRWWWRDRGPTDLDNLIPLCERHHHLVHEGGWGLSMTPERVATWTRPDGTVHHVGTTIDRTASSSLLTTSS